MDFDADKAAKLVALIGYGLAFRNAYYHLVQQRKEDSSAALLWAAIWSAPLKIFFEAVGRPPVAFGLKLSPAQVTAFAFIYDIGFSWLLGTVFGLCTTGLTNLRRSAPDHWLAKLSRGVRIPRLDVIQEWMQTACVGRFVFVQMKDGRGYRGWIRFYDLQQDRAKSMHFVLADPVAIDVATGSIVSNTLGSEVLISMPEVQLFRLL